MDENQFDILVKKLDTITTLLASNIIHDKPVSEQIALLTNSGLKVSEIALILGKTENQVYVTQTTLRKKKISKEAQHGKKGNDDVNKKTDKTGEENNE